MRQSVVNRRGFWAFWLLFCVFWLLGFVFYVFWLPLRWLLGLHFEDVADKAPCIVRDVATIFGLVLTFGVALTISVQPGLASKWWAIGLYVLVSLSLLGMMVAILRTRGGPNDKGHAFDRGSLMFTRFALVSGSVIVGSFFFLAVLNLLPGQSEGFDKVAHAKLGTPKGFNYEDEHKTPGIMVPVELNRELYPSKIPPMLIMVISLNDTLKHDWVVEDLMGYRSFEPELKKMEPPPSPHPDGKKDGSQTSWILRELHDKQLYTLKIYLQAKTDKVDSEAAKKLIEAEKALKVDFYSRAE